MRSTAPSCRWPEAFAAVPHLSVATTRTWEQSAIPTPVTRQGFCATILESRNWKPADCRSGSFLTPPRAPRLVPWGPARRFCWSPEESSRPSTTIANSGWKARSRVFWSASALTAQDLCLAILQAVRAIHGSSAGSQRHHCAGVAALPIASTGKATAFKTDAHLLLRLHRQQKMKHRTAPQLAGDADFAAMGFDNRPGDRQPHARALHPVSLILASIELVKNQSLLHIFDTRALIGDTDFEVGASFNSAVIRIGDSAAEYLAAFSNNWTRTSRIRSASKRALISSGTLISIGCLPRVCLTSRDRSLYQIKDTRILEVELKFVRFQLRYFRSLTDQTV